MFLIVLLLAVLILPVFAAESSSVRITTVGNMSLVPINYEPYPAQPNQVEHLWIKVQNVGGETVENSAFKLIPTFPFSLTAGDSGILYEGTMNSGETRLLEYDIRVDKDATQGYYDLSIGVCADSACNNYQKMTFQLYVNTGGVAKIETLVDNFDSVTGGSPGSITISIVNRGDLNIKFLVISIGKSDDYTLLNPDKIYVGELASDDFETINLNLYASPNITKTKDVTMPITLEFTDINNKEYTLNQDVTFPIYSKEDLSKYSLTKSSNSGSTLLVIAFFVLIIVAYFIWKKKKNKT
jgi:hypothetical protein